MRSTEQFPTDPEHRVKQFAYRGVYDKPVAFSILDAGFFCHIGFIADGKPVVIPMTYWREGEYVYFHSATGGRFAEACIGNEICLTVTHFDGLVLGHSASNHSYNYRSIVIHGRAEVEDDFEAKRRAMKSFLDSVIPQRYEQVRDIGDADVRSIRLMRLKMVQVSVKVRDEFPDKEHITPDWPAWIGVIPAKTVFGPPIADPVRNKISLAPAYIADYKGHDDHQSRIAIIATKPTT